MRGVLSPIRRARGVCACFEKKLDDVARRNQNWVPRSAGCILKWAAFVPTLRRGEKKPAPTESRCGKSWYTRQLSINCVFIGVLQKYVRFLKTEIIYLVFRPGKQLKIRV